MEETIHRVKLYENAGADGVFVPCVETMTDIAQIIASTTLPINVMCMPNLPNFKCLKELGVKRISMGNFLFEKMYQHLEREVEQLQKEQSFHSVFKLA